LCLNEKLLDHRWFRKIVTTKNNRKIQNKLSSNLLKVQTDDARKILQNGNVSLDFNIFKLWNLEQAKFRNGFLGLSVKMHIYSSLFLLSWASAAISLALSRALSKMSPALPPAFSIALSIVGECFLNKGRITFE